MKINVKELDLSDLLELFISTFDYNQTNDDYLDFVDVKDTKCFNKFSDSFFKKHIANQLGAFECMNRLRLKTQRRSFKFKDNWNPREHNNISQFAVQTFLQFFNDPPIVFNELTFNTNNEITSISVSNLGSHIHDQDLWWSNTTPTLTFDRGIVNMEETNMLIFEYQKIDIIGGLNFLNFMDIRNESI